MSLVAAVLGGMFGGWLGATDRVDFDLRLVGEQARPPVDVAGIEETLGGGGMVAGGPTISTTLGSSGAGDAAALGRAVPLPMTGATLPLWVVLLDLMTIALGIVLVARGRRGGVPAEVAGA